MTYLCETIPAREGGNVEQSEIKQRAKDAPRTMHPETGEPVRRVILRGWGFVSSKPSGGNSSQGGCRCGPSGCR